MPTTSTLTCFRYTICNSKRTFKSKAGLQQHESLKHYNYKEISAHILLVPEYKLHHIKNAIIKELQKQLKNHYSKVENQVFSIHCSENSFVGIFGQYLTRYSVCGGWYQSFFVEEEAIDQLTEIFDDYQWAERNYGNGQLLWIKLYKNEKMNKAALESKFKSKKLLFRKGIIN
ncbi:7103_t:CDS:1 [Dentiscutata erythropus]|uniref:7103_t:CDS:1 n=1 Tax=Dentiscutata erythropus TaxID=1348616 RepID=A0A9N9I611_9GLOM|nr:7103_t:CDS:1 [Dentiscutata erythropus]